MWRRGRADRVRERGARARCAGLPGAFDAEQARWRGHVGPDDLDRGHLDHDFADAHFNVALTCEQFGQAQRHWQRYLMLDPAGEWAAITREHLSGSAP